MHIIERLKVEGLEVNREYDYFVVEDSEGHIATLDIEGVLLTMLDSRTNLGFEVVEDIRKLLEDK